MRKRRASIKGRGAAILFGEEEEAPFAAREEEKREEPVEEVEAKAPKVEAPPKTKLEGILMEAPPPTVEAPAPPPPEVPARPLTPEEEEEAKMRAARERLDVLGSEIYTLYQKVAEELSSREDLSERALSLLGKARGILLKRPQDFDEAERNVAEVRTLITRVENSRAWSSYYGNRLLVYEAAFFVVLLAALLFDKPLATLFSYMVGTSAGGTVFTSMTEAFPPWNTLIWGGIGGVVGALYSLHWHVAEKQDFDKQHNMWYIVQPFMGLILGGIIYLVIATGFLALSADIASAQAGRAVQWFPSLIACLAGFRQKFAYELLDNIMQVIGRRPPETKR